MAQAEGSSDGGSPGIEEEQRQNDQSSEEIVAESLDSGHGAIVISDNEDERNLEPLIKTVGKCKTGSWNKHID